MERGGTNFLPSLREGAVTSLVMLPCLEKVQLQIISQLWETPPGVNNSLSKPECGFRPKTKLWSKPGTNSPSTFEAKCLSGAALIAFGKLSSLVTLTDMVRLMAEGLKDLTLEELWAGSSAWLG